MGKSKETQPTSEGSKDRLIAEKDQTVFLYTYLDNRTGYLQNSAYVLDRAVESPRQAWGELMRSLQGDPDNVLNIIANKDLMTIVDFSTYQKGFKTFIRDGESVVYESPAYGQSKVQFVDAVPLTLDEAKQDCIELEEAVSHRASAVWEALGVILKQNKQKISRVKGGSSEGLVKTRCLRLAEFDPERHEIIALGLPKLAITSGSDKP